MALQTFWCNPFISMDRSDTVSNYTYIASYIYITEWLHGQDVIGYYHNYVLFRIDKLLGGKNQWR